MDEFRIRFLFYVAGSAMFFLTIPQTFLFVRLLERMEKRHGKPIPFSGSILFTLDVLLSLILYVPGFYALNALLS